LEWQLKVERGKPQHPRRVHPCAIANTKISSADSIDGAKVAAARMRKPRTRNHKTQTECFETVGTAVMVVNVETV